MVCWQAKPKQVLSDDIDDLDELLEDIGAVKDGSLCRCLTRCGFSDSAVTHETATKLDLKPVPSSGGLSKCVVTGRCARCCSTP
jgi:hypothetical protein